jgi:hypothetical protein
MGDFTVKDVSQNKTRVEILAEADEIYAKWKKMCKEKNVKRSEVNDPKNDAILDEIYTVLQKEHYDFAMAYPIQLRYMTQLGQYHHTAMDLFLKKLEQGIWKDEKEYIEYQANYVKLTYMKMHDRWTRQELNEVYEKAKNILTKERLEFKQQVEKVQAQMDKEELGLQTQKRQDMMELLKKKLTEQLENISIKKDE